MPAISSNSSLSDLERLAASRPTQHHELLRICRAAAQTGPWFAEQPLNCSLSTESLGLLEFQSYINGRVFAAWLVGNIVSTLTGIDTRAASKLRSRMEDPPDQLLGESTGAVVDRWAERAEVDESFHYQLFADFFDQESGFCFPHRYITEFANSPANTGANGVFDPIMVDSAGRLVDAGRHIWIGWAQSVVSDQPDPLQAAADLFQRFQVIDWAVTYQPNLAMIFERSRA